MEKSGRTPLSLSRENTGDHRAYTWESGRETLTAPALAWDELDPPLDDTEEHPQHRDPGDVVKHGDLRSSRARGRMRSARATASR